MNNSINSKFNYNRKNDHLIVLVSQNDNDNDNENAWLKYLCSSLKKIIDGYVYLSFGSPYRCIKIERFMLKEDRKKINGVISELAEFILYLRDEKFSNKNELSGIAKEKIEACLELVNTIIDSPDDSRRFRAYDFIKTLYFRPYFDEIVYRKERQND